MAYYIVKDGFSGSTGQTVTCSDEMNALVFVNDSDSATMTVTISNASKSRTFSVGPKGIFDEITDPFTSVQIVGTGNFYGWTRRRSDEQM